MNSDIINKLVELSGKTEDEVNELVDDLTMDQMYTIIDAMSKKDDAKLLDTFNQITNTVEEAMGKKTTIKGKLPKPRDPIAKALALPQNQPKQTPNKKGKLEKMDRKHKGRTGDDAGASFAIESVVTEGVVSVVPEIKRMLALAGQPSDTDAINKTMEDMFDIKVSDLPDFGRFGVETTPLGLKLTPGVVSMDDPEDLSDLMVDPVDPQVDDTQAYEPESEEFAWIRSNLESICLRLENVTVAELAKVKELIAELNSCFDKLRNQVSK